MLVPVAAGGLQLGPSCTRHTTSTECGGQLGCVWTSAGACRDPASCCDDGDASTIADHPRVIQLADGPAVVCVGTFQCDDGNPCTLDRWDGTACVHEAWLPSSGSSESSVLGATAATFPPPDVPIVACDDGDPCTFLDRCLGAECRGIPAVPQPVQVGPCEQLVCDGVGGAVWLPRVGTPCYDGNVCTGPDACAEVGGAGVCVPGPPRSCDDGDPCTTLPSCSHPAGCAGTPKPDGTPCDDGVACTLDDACHPDVGCRGTSDHCDDDDSATSDWCDTATGSCQHAPAFSEPTAPVADIRVTFSAERDVGIISAWNGSSFEDTRVITWCSSAVSVGINLSEPADCGANGCSEALRPSCFAYECEDQLCAPPSATVGASDGARFVPGRLLPADPPAPGELENLALTNAADAGFLALNTRSLFGTPNPEDTAVPFTLAFWLGADQVDGAYGLGRVPLIDTRRVSGGNGARLRVEIGHGNEVDPVHVPGSEDGFGEQEGRDLRVLLVDLEAESGTRRRVWFGLRRWTRGSWHHVAISLGEETLCLHVDGLRAACGSLSAGMFRPQDLPDYFYVLGSTRVAGTPPTNEPVPVENARGRARIWGLSVYRRELTDTEVRAAYRAQVPEGLSLQSGSMTLSLASALDGFGIRNLEAFGERWTTVAPPRSLFRLRIVPRRDLHTGLHLRPADRQASRDPSRLDPQGQPDPAPSPPPYSPAYDDWPPAIKDPEADGTATLKRFFSGGNTPNPFNIHSPWAFFLDNLSVTQAAGLPTHGTLPSPDLTLHWLKWEHVPLPSPLDFVAGPQDSDPLSDAKRGRVVLPFRCQPPGPVGWSGGDAWCPESVQPAAGEIRSIVVYLWTRPGDTGLNGTVVVDLDSEYWSLGESEFPVLDGLELRPGTTQSLVAPADNLGVEVPVASTGTSLQPLETNAQGRLFYPGRGMSMPFLGLVRAGDRALYVGAHETAPRPRWFGVTRTLVQRLNGSSLWDFQAEVPPEPHLRFVVSEPAEGLGTAGNDLPMSDRSIRIAFTRGGWYGLAQEYRHHRLRTGWHGGQDAQPEQPPRILSAGYYTEGASAGLVAEESKQAALLGLPSDLPLLDYRRWDRLNGLSEALYGDPSQPSDMPFLYEGIATELQDFDTLRAGQSDRRRRRAVSFAANLVTDGALGPGVHVPGGPVMLYTNPMLADLGREWALPAGFVPAFSRMLLWPYFEAQGLEGDVDHILVPDTAAPVAWSAGGRAFEAGRSAVFANVTSLGAGPSYPQPAGMVNFQADPDPTVGYTRDFPVSECRTNSQAFYMCPGSQAWREEVVDRLVAAGRAPADPDRAYRPSALYLDQVPTLDPRLCTSPAHDHPPGGGSYWAQGWRDVIDAIRAGLRNPAWSGSGSYGGASTAAGIVAEGFSDPYVFHSDAFLVVHDSFSQTVPLAQAVFHDAATFIGRHTELADVGTATGADAQQVRLALTALLQGKAFVWGDMPGGLTNGGDSAQSWAYAYLRRLGEWRRNHSAPLQYGQMLPPVDVAQIGPAVGVTPATACGTTSPPLSITADPVGTALIAAASGGPLDTLHVTARTKDSGLRTWDEPAVAASLWSGSDGVYLVAASLDTTARRDVVVSANAPPSVTTLTATRLHADGTAEPPVGVSVSDGRIHVGLSLPPCAVTIVRLSPSGGGQP